MFLGEIGIGKTEIGRFLVVLIERSGLRRSTGRTSVRLVEESTFY